MSLTNYIRDDLIRKISAGEDLSRRLSLTELSRHYGVSFTPLRAALGDLVEKGYVVRLPNRRLRVNQRKAGAGTAAPKATAPRTPSDWDTVLLKEVTHASLSRSAVYLREESLARRLGVGRSIIRGAFSRFAGAGLIEHVPRRGWLIHPLNQEDMAAYLVVRETLELKALDLARGRLERDNLEKLVRANSPRGARLAEKLDNRLHEYIIERSGNRYIRRFFQQYVARYYTELFYQAAPETAVVGLMAKQHRSIIRAAAAKDWSRTRTLLTRHIRAQGPILMRLLQKVQRRAVG